MLYWKNPCPLQFDCYDEQTYRILQDLYLFERSAKSKNNNKYKKRVHRFKDVDVLDIHQERLTSLGKTKALGFEYRSPELPPPKFKSPNKSSSKFALFGAGFIGNEVAVVIIGI